MNSPLKSNRILWDSLADLHIDDPWYKLSDFLAGSTSLKAPELSLVGDVEGKSILHLQCHFGLDSMSWARRGASVVGVDFSKKAIGKAQELADALKLDCTFILTELHELPAVLDQKFDIVFTSYGVLDWLPTLDRWAEIVAHFLKPGGYFAMIEFHPLLAAFDLEEARWKYPYFNTGKPTLETMEQSYTGTRLDQPKEMFLWSHSASEIVRSLLQAELLLEDMVEYDYSPYNCLPKLINRGQDEWVWPDAELPFLLGIKCTKPYKQHLT